MRRRNNNFRELDGRGLGRGQRPDQNDSTDDYSPRAGGDPWAKLAFDITNSNFDTIKKLTQVCPRCKGKMEYIAVGEYRCKTCRMVTRDDYGKVRAYIDAHGRATSLEIEEATGVPKEVVDTFLRQGKLEITSGPSGYLRCELCGADIRFGRICSKCARTDGAKMKGYYVEDVGEAPYAARDSGEMRFVKKRNERLSEGFSHRKKRQD